MAGGLVVNGIAKWNYFSETWSALGSGTGSSTRALAVSSSGDLYVGGDFIGAGGVSAFNIAKWNGSTWSAFGSGTNGVVYAMAVDSTTTFTLGDGLPPLGRE
jgi:hypothetical protein